MQPDLSQMQPDLNLGQGVRRYPDVYKQYSF